MRMDADEIIKMAKAYALYRYGDFICQIGIALPNRTRHNNTTVYMNIDLHVYELFLSQ